MKCMLTLMISLFVAVSTALAQKPVILESNGTSTAFGAPDAFINAYNAASDGDTIYLGGMGYTIPNPFEKQLTVYGAGYHPDHTEATGQAFVSGTVNIRAGASGSRFEGIRFSGEILFAEEKITDITFHRCYFGYRGGSSQITLNGLEEDPSDNITISESILTHRLTGRRTINLNLYNNIIHANVSAILREIEHGWISNNIIIGAARSTFVSGVLEDVHHTTIENNIIHNSETTRADSMFINMQNNTIRRNVIRSGSNMRADVVNNNIFTDNYFNINIEDIFINYPGGNFSFEGDYNLIEPETFMGTTGNQVGIYGGITPFKANTRPSNLQIMSANIAAQAGSDGGLNVQIEVEAQDY